MILSKLERDFAEIPGCLETGAAKLQIAIFGADFLCRRRREIVSLTPYPTVNPTRKIPKIKSSSPNMEKHLVHKVAICSGASVPNRSRQLKSSQRGHGARKKRSPPWSYRRASNPKTERASLAVALSPGRLTRLDTSPRKREAFRARGSQTVP